MQTCRAFGVIVLLTSTAFAQSAQPVPADLLKTETAREAAMFAGDEQTWTRYTTNDFMFITGDGSVQTQADRGRGINGVKFTGPRVSEKVYHVHGNTVLVTSLREQDAGPYRQTTVWVKESGDWKVASVQHTTVSRK